MSFCGFYGSQLRQRRFNEVKFMRWEEELFSHFFVFAKNYAKTCEMSGDEYVNNMLQSASHWVDSAEKEFLSWGICILGNLMSATWAWLSKDRLQHLGTIDE